jgi:hypothetical protein
VTKLQKKILIFLVVLSCLSPVGILLPEYLNSSGAWGEWSADTVRKKTGYTPEGMQKYSEKTKAPLPDYSFNENDKSLFHNSIYYIISGIIGVALTILITYFISKIIIRHDK